MCFCPPLSSQIGVRGSALGVFCVARAAVCLASLPSLPGILPEAPGAEGRGAEPLGPCPRPSISSKQGNGVLGLVIAITPPEIQHPDLHLSILST